jgi:hypothetical protein
MSYHLRQRGREHIILERRRVGFSWNILRVARSAAAIPNRRSGSDLGGFTELADRDAWAAVLLVKRYGDDAKNLSTVVMKFITDIGLAI